MAGPFKMKNHGLSASAKYKTPIQYASPAKRADVLINGENVGTGDEAYAKGRIAEAKKKAAWSKGTAGTEEERNSKENKDNDKTKQTKVTYTGDDAHKRTKDSDLSSAEKRDKQAEIRAGGSFDA